jgi:hypothetical protein
VASQHRYVVAKSTVGQLSQPLGDPNPRAPVYPIASSHGRTRYYTRELGSYWTQQYALCRVLTNFMFRCMRGGTRGYSFALDLLSLGMLNYDQAKFCKPHTIIVSTVEVFEVV